MRKLFLISLVFIFMSTLSAQNDFQIKFRKDFLRCNEKMIELIQVPKTVYNNDLSKEIYHAKKRFEKDGVSVINDSLNFYYLRTNKTIYAFSILRE